VPGGLTRFPLSRRQIIHEQDIKQHAVFASVTLTLTLTLTMNLVYELDLIIPRMYLLTEK